MILINMYPSEDLASAARVASLSLTAAIPVRNGASMYDNIQMLTIVVTSRAMIAGLKLIVEKNGNKAMMISVPVEINETTTK